jgi:putative addiction module component (TIGR02574 family)
MATKTQRGIDEIEAEVLRLDLPSRAALPKALLDSLETLSEEEYDQLWAEEAEARYADLKAGRTKAIDGDQVFAKARARAR